MNISELYEYGESSLADNVPVAKAIVKNMICQEHHKKVSLKYDYLNDGTHAYISRYCCLHHAQAVAHELEKAKLFDHVSIEHD